MVRLWVANTDPDWFDFLSGQPDIDEVNFWQPNGNLSFGAIRPGELFLFRLKSPRNAIGGYGVFSHSSNVPISLAWEAFGVKNGASTLAEMRERVGRYRNDVGNHEDYTIGCRIVVQPVFLLPEEWIPQPANWSRSIVVGKTFSTDDKEGMALWEALAQVGSYSHRPARGFAEEQRRFGEPTLIKPRLGQGAFRIAVTDAYKRACAVSGGKVLPALEAAHIQPYAAGGSHEISNGILLRRDIHSVFDAGYVTIDDGLKFVVSDRVRTDFNNGNEYRRMHGSDVSVPTLQQHRPSTAALRWHNEKVFLG
ncbi:MAG: HNH endonuclease [Alphaproteobacteria bacterium]|nr:HNH endonuclease [Alphaproteobacteria bacterium]MDE2073782.1 HNH endonuclease [Alphaproteobacteria bacterium]MDE2351046.1 HNH endonuclease [Alphaproteobacteria bacterium]